MSLLQNLLAGHSFGMGAALGLYLGNTDTLPAEFLFLSPETRSDLVRKIDSQVVIILHLG